MKKQIFSEIENGGMFIGDYHLIRELYISWNMDISQIPILNDRLIILYKENDEIKFKNNII